MMGRSLAFVIFLFTEDGVPLDNEAVQHLEHGQIPQEEIDLLFLVEIDVQAVQDGHGDERLHCELQVFNRIAGEVEFNNLGELREIVRKLANVIIAQVDLSRTISQSVLLDFHETMQLTLRSSVNLPSRSTE